MKKLDKLISENLQALIEAPCGVDPEEKWQSFKEKYQTERLVREKEGTDTELEREKIRIPFGLKFAYIAAGLVVAFTCCMMNPQVVSAFRDQVFKWVGQNQENELVISQIRNPVTPPGDYGGISFAEAQALVLFDLQYPHYLPESLAAVEPQINVNVNEDGYSSVTFSFIKGEAYLKITQRQDVLQSNKNTFVPQDTEVSEITIHNNVKAVVLETEDYTDFQWQEKNIGYRLMARGIDREELIKVIEELKTEA
jgi:hypothetical protein